MHYFRGSFIFTVIAIGLAGVLGYSAGGTFTAAFLAMFSVSVLGVLETSLSFDNAVVNAEKLKDMSDSNRRFFLTWGMLIAVAGMRVVFPLLIVGIAGHLNPIAALTLALQQPAEYERILTSVHAEIASFGGAFLLMVGLRYFFDEEKDVHWVKSIETLLAKGSRLYMAEASVVMAVLGASAFLLPQAERFMFLVAGLAGLGTYAAVQWLEVILDEEEDEGITKIASQAVKSGIAGVIYLEVLDASFSFDGVIGAFAISNNIFIIGLGLGIGAMFVRSMTVMLVEKGTLAEYKYLEHGAFWAILGLGACMFAGLFVHIPEAVTGLIGAVLIGAALFSSLRAKKAAAVTAV